LPPEISTESEAGRRRTSQTAHMDHDYSGAHLTLASLAVSRCITVTYQKASSVYKRPQNVHNVYV
jgi:hypothetical protein